MRNLARKVAMLALTTAAVVSGVAVDLTPAAAADVAPLASCARTYEDDLNKLPDSGTYWYGTPSTALHHTVDCATISIRVLTSASVCAQYRVRFFPSDGSSSFVNSWKQACSGEAINVATSVRDNTAYRIESTHHRLVRVRD